MLSDQWDQLVTTQSHFSGAGENATIERDLCDQWIFVIA